VISVYVNFVLCGALFWTCFCRVVRTNGDTHLPVRTAFVVLAMVAIAVAVGPFGWLAPCMPVQRPSAGQLALEGAMLLVQGLTARYWKDGVPCHFQRQGERA